MAVPVPNGHDSLRVPWLPTDGSPSDKAIFFTSFGFFLAVLFAVSHWSWSKNASGIAPDKKYNWHFMGGKNYNALLGTFTLFSTIFSAVTIAGVPFEASATGFFSLRWLTSGVWIGLGAMFMAPRGYRINTNRNYDCPNDYVTDRYNNRLLSVFSSLISAASVFLYIIIQLYAIADLMPAMSKTSDGSHAFDRNVTTWILGFVILICEWIGGFDAVTYTDLLQSVALLIAFLALPMAYAYYYGALAGAGDSFGYDCANFYEVDCTQPEFVAFKSPCSSSSSAAAFKSGCLAYNSQSYLQMHPAGSETSKYFEPLTKVAASGCTYNYNQSLPDCTPTVLTQLGWFGVVPPTSWGVAAATFPQTGPYSEERAWADKQFNSPLPTYLGVDGSSLFSRTAANMMSFNLLFFSLPLFPHWVMKGMSIKTDKEAKVAYSILSFATVWSTFPMLLIGISGAALLKAIHPDAGTEFFAVILDDLANKGGFPEYLAALGATGAIAAMMSTVDSALIAVTNLISTDFLRNWLMRDAEDSKLLNVCRAISGVTIVVCIVITLYEPALNNDANVYSTLIAWQSSLLWQILPVGMMSMYVDLNAWALIIGQVVGICAIIGLYIQQDSCHNWNTAYAWKENSYVYDKVLDGNNHPEACNPNTYYLDYHIWAAVINVGVTVITSILFTFLDFGNTIAALEVGVESRYGGTDALSMEEIEEMMDETREVVKDPAGIICMIIAAALTTFSLPWYGDSYDNCDFDSYARWEACEIAGVDCKAMCDVADMSLAPPFPVPALMTAASACLTNPAVDCTCPLQGGYFTFASGSTNVMIPTDPVANVSYSESVASLLTGGSFQFTGTGNGKICEGYTLTNGIPHWAMVVIACWVVAMFFVFAAWMRWGTVDEFGDKKVAVNPTTDGFGFDSKKTAVTGF